MDQLPRLGKRELICLLSFTCNYVVFVWRGFLFLWVLGMGYVILLWHSLSLPYNYFVSFTRYESHPISSDNGLKYQKLLLKSELCYPLHVAMGVAYSCSKYGVLSQPDLMLYKFVYNNMRARSRENHAFNKFLSGVDLVRDAVCFFGKSY